MGIERDVVFDITVEGNRPDAWSMAGVARDLAARLGLSFTLPTPAPGPEGSTALADIATARVDAPELCPRLVVRVLEDVTIGPSRAGWPDVSPSPACARSTTSSTRRTM